MKKDDYIDAVLTSFKGRNKKIIKDELSSHLDDRIERFVEMGYSLSRADEMAVEKMGDAKEVGVSLTKLHSRKSAAAASIILFLIYAAITLFLLFHLWQCDVNLYMLCGEAAFLILSVIGLLSSNRLKNSFPAVISFLFTIVMIVTKAFMGFHSMLLFGAYILLSGRLDEFLIITQVDNKLDNRILFYLTIAFYSLWLIAHIFTFSNIFKFEKIKYAKQNLQQESVFKGMIIMVAVFFTVITAVLTVSKLTDDYGMSFQNDNASYYDGVCILESEEECDIKSFYYSNFNLLSKRYLHNKPDKFEFGDKNFGGGSMSYDNRYNDSLTYMRNNWDINYYTYSKKYIAVVPFCIDETASPDDEQNYYQPCFDNVKWYDTANTEEIIVAMNRDTDPIDTGVTVIRLYDVSERSDYEIVYGIRDMVWGLGTTGEGLNEGYESFSENDIKRFEAITNSKYLGDDGNETHIYHFMIDDRIDMLVFFPEKKVTYYHGYECLLEHSFERSPMYR